MNLVHENVYNSKRDIFVEALKKSDIGREIYPFMSYIFGSSWIKRVWTLQECVLPEKVYFVAEYDDSPVVPLENVIRLCKHLGSYSRVDYEAPVEGMSIGDTPHYTKEFSVKYKNGAVKLREIGRIASEYTNFKDIRKLYREGSTIGILEELGSSRRISTKKVDYIHGVAGLLDVKITGKTMDRVCNSLIASLWSKDIFMPKEYYRRQVFDDEDEDVGLSKEFARDICQRMFVMSNKSTLIADSITERNFGAVIHSVYISGKLAEIPDFHCNVNGCVSSWRFPRDLCVGCGKIYKKKSAITVLVFGERAKMNAIEISDLLFDNADDRHTWSRNNSINQFHLKHVYVTKKRIIALENKYIGDDIVIPLYGKFGKYYREKVGYEIATIVDIDKHGNKENIGRVYHRNGK
jgi:hypothetical protein